MTCFVRPRLANGPAGDSTLLLDFAFGRRAVLFDLGDLAQLAPREILRVSDVFVSHLHMDHFAGFDRLLRVKLHGDGTVRMVGPPGLADAVAAKLAAYRWNLLGPDSGSFAIEAMDWTENGFETASLFRAREAFRRREIAPPSLPTGCLLAEPGFQVEGATLDHGIACLAFALQETLRVNVHKARLDEMGLGVGPWLTAAKALVRAGAGVETPVEGPRGEVLPLSALIAGGVLVAAPGQRVAYVTDSGWTEANRTRILALAKGADMLFIEAGFLDADRAVANGRHHLTAAQAGRLAREAGARRAVPHHFSARYEGRGEELVAEFEAAYRRSGEA